MSSSSSISPSSLSLSDDPEHCFRSWSWRRHNFRDDLNASGVNGNCGNLRSAVKAAPSSSSACPRWSSSPAWRMWFCSNCGPCRCECVRLFGTYEKWCVHVTHACSFTSVTLHSRWYAICQLLATPKQLTPTASVRIGFSECSTCDDALDLGDSSVHSYCNDHVPTLFGMDNPKTLG